MNLNRLIGVGFVILLALAIVFVGIEKYDGTIDIMGIDSTKYVALTFDDGPKTGKTDVLLDGLKKRDAKVTFFMIGLQIEGNEEIIQQVYEDGHQIGNHTYDHVNIPKLTEEAQKQEIEDWYVAIRQVIPLDSFTVRPPYGNTSDSFLGWIDSPIILWSVDTRDWDHRSASEIANHIVSNVQDGDIVIMHDVYNDSVKGALMAIDTLAEQGYVFVTVDELFKVKGIELEDGKVYKHAH